MISAFLLTTWSMTRVLVREAVVVMAPDVGRQQVVEEAIGRRHGISLVTFNHFAC